ncbi:unnamed protein product [Acidocella sp. C78]|uniref:hypothetical protein n=1 Tax=Acidocella sp. C78 TaxID=1671486 RepID=UPI00191BBDD3|nr:hypothetical protein [Acidocella sp. C78]CAG4903381.1 unnamed protein product [Acidocella sp. C78]
MNRRSTIRAAMASAAAAMVAPAVANAAGNPDDELIAMADRYIALDAQYNAAYRVPDLTMETEEKIDQQTAPMQDEMNDILDRITRTEAKTPAGVAAIARVVTAYLDPSERDPEDEDRYLSDRLISRLTREAGRLA